MLPTTLKNSKNKAKAKSLELAKVKFNRAFTKNGIKIKIVGDIEPINVNGKDGVEVFAQAWKNGKQLGFGKDGSVDIERFRIFNPPVLVDDPNGKIAREWTDSHTGLLTKRHLRFDPKEALLQTLEHTICLVGKENTKITKGKVGNTTSTFYPAAGANSPVDGATYYNNATSFAQATGATDGTGSQDNSALDRIVKWDDLGSGSMYLTRGFFLFDTSTIPDTDIIDSAILSHYITSFDNNDGSEGWEVVACTPASNAAIGTADHDQIGSVSFGTMNFTSVVINQYNDVSLNSSGLADISKTGISKFATILKGDLSGTEPVGTSNRAVAYYADQTGTSQDPKLVVVHSASASPENAPFFGCNF